MINYLELYYVLSLVKILGIYDILGLAQFFCSYITIVAIPIMSDVD